MAQPSGKTLEGIFAISKPPSLSSAQVLRDLQHEFAASETFAPLLQQTRRNDRRQPKRRKRGNDQAFKMGHGGTLDPLATGVLIVGIGRGTKALGGFLDCKKTYETIVLFGKSTDTYDVAGKIVAEAPTSTINRTTIEEQLAQFQGPVKQMPPIYSAIKIDGMKLYDYARSGKQLPREIETRDVQIHECSLLEYYAPGEHEFRWPAEHAAEDEKTVARLLMDQAESVKSTAPRPRPVESPGHVPPPSAGIDAAKINTLDRGTKAALHIHPLPTQESTPAQAPAALIRLTVSSGFYVRSFAHDLGIACGSYGTMAALVRSRQASFTDLDPAPEGFHTTLKYKELEDGEAAWGPKIKSMLESWLEINPDISTENRIDDRDRPEKQYSHKRGGFRHTRQDAERMLKRRNSSSSEN